MTPEILTRIAELHDRIEAAEHDADEARAERDALIRYLRKTEGLTLQAIADMFGMTKPRVHQLTTQEET